jgi:hypothetical protein
MDGEAHGNSNSSSQVNHRSLPTNNIHLTPQLVKTPQ